MAEGDISSILEGINKTFEQDIHDSLWGGFSKSVVGALDRELEKKIEEEKRLLNRTERIDLNNVNQLERWLEWVQEEDEEDEKNKPINDFIKELENELQVNKDIENANANDSDDENDPEFEAIFNEKLKLLVDKFKQACQDLDSRIIVEDKNQPESVDKTSKEKA